MLGFDELSDADQATVVKARQLERFLTQPFSAAEPFTGTKGRQVEIRDTLTGCERILSGEFIRLPPGAFYMIGGIDERRGR
jgi:F-type H+-transporting ATPase subunit beta